MEHALLTVVTSIIVAALWLGLLLLIQGSLRIYRRLRTPQVVTCPATQSPAALDLGVKSPGMSSNHGPQQRHVRRCSRWPEHAQCDQACLQQVEATTEVYSWDK